MTKKNASQKQSSSKKRTRKKSPKKSPQTGRLSRFLIAVVGTLIVALLMGIAGWIGYEAGSQNAVTACKQEVARYRSDVDRLRERLQHAANERVLPQKASKRLPPPPKAASAKKEELSEIKDYVEAGGKEKEAVKTIERKSLSVARPKLTIIIDDVAFASQVRAIRKLPWAVTPSLFPPTKRHPDTPKIAKSLKHYMIHLPMEAMHYNRPEDETLTTKSDEAAIDSRLRKIRAWFPGAHFINNHTGSGFTSDLASMERFYPLAKKYGFIFIDSRTTPKTVVPKVCRIYHDPYVARDIFLDNKPEKGYIQNQLKKAVRIAKSHGYAIAIGHPHASTLDALADSKKILQGVDVIYIDELYKTIR